MKLSIRQVDLELKHPFTIARGTRTNVPSVIISIEHDGIIGYGEASPSTRYGENQETVFSFLKSIDFAGVTEPFQIEEILLYIENLAEGNTAAKAAIDIALHDWIGKRLGIPLWKYFGLTQKMIPVSSFTIGIDSTAMIHQKLEEAGEYPILKIKLGVPNDREIVRAIRRVTDKPLRVDANEGWKTKEEALENICWLEEQNVELVEQPMPADNLDEIGWLRERVHIPLYADESVKRSGDILKLAGKFDGINIKLMKCAGIREAMKMIHTAKAAGMKIMLGCMIESSLGIAAAGQLSSQADCLDLDGNLLISNDPFEGIGMRKGHLILSDEPGFGVHPRII